VSRIGLGQRSRDLFELVRRNGTLVRASLMYVGERFAAAIASLLVFVVLARLYGPHDFGVWSYTLGVMQFAAAALVGAAEPVVVRELVHRPGRASVVLGSGVVMLAASSVLALAVPLAFLFYRHGEDQAVMGIALFSALAHGVMVFAVVEHYFRAAQLPLPIAAARLVALGVGAFAKIAMAFSGYDIFMLGWAMVLESVVHMGMLWMAYRKHHARGAGWQFSREVGWMLMRSCLPAMLAAVAVTLFFRVNYLILESLQGFEEVGYYAFAFNIMQLVVLIPTMALAGLYPRLCELVVQDPSRFRRVVSWLFFGAAVFGYASAALVALVGGQLISVFFGARYLGAVPVLTWMFVALAAISTASVRAAVINVHQAQGLHFWSALVGLLTIVPISLLLVPQYGSMGAAIAVVAGALASGLLTSFVFPQLRPHAMDQLRALLLLTPLFDTPLRRSPRLPIEPVPVEPTDSRR
jgi:O-antigen/teichoic acid export membrane protein